VWHVAGAAVYVALAVLALRSPNALTALVAGGLLLSGSLLIADDGPNLFAVLIMLMSVVATAEMLGVAALLATPVERDARNDLRRAAIAVTIAGAAFGVMMLVSVLPVRSVLWSGIPAIAIASGACVLLAIVLVSSRFAPRV